MVLDPETGLTLKQVYDFLDDLVENNRGNLEELRDTINTDYDVSDNVLDEIEHKEKLSPNDIRTLARAVGMDYELLTSDKLADDFTDRFISAVNNLFALRRQYRSNKPEVQNGI